METHSNNRSEVQALKIVENKIPAGSYSQTRGHTQVHRTKAADMYASAANKKCRHKVHALSCREKRAHGKSYDWSMVFSPTFLILWFWSMVFASKVLNPGFGSLVLDLYGFGPWFQ